MGIRDARSRKAFRTSNLQINGCVLVFVKVFCRIGVCLSFFADGNFVPPLCCSRCGQIAEGRVGDEVICDKCYQISGSCCPEFDPACLNPPSPHGNSQQAADEA